MSRHRRPGRGEQVFQWSFLLALPVILAAALAVYVLMPRQKGPERLPLPPSTSACDPAQSPCVLVEYLLYRDKVNRLYA